MIHWYVALGAGFVGLIVGMALGWLAGISARVEAAITKVGFRFP